MSQITLFENSDKVDKYLLFLIIFILLIPQLNLSSAENIRASVLTYMILPEDESLITLGDVINDSILLELKIAGFKTPHNKIEKELIKIDKMIKNAKDSGSQFLILDSYELDNDQIKFKIDCYEADNGELLISIEKEEQVGFFLDSAINESMSEVIKKIDETLPETEETLFNPEKIITDKSEIEDEINDKRILLSTSVSPFMTTGKAGNYFTHGWEFYIYGGYPLEYKALNFYGGLFFLINKFKSEGILISSENYFLSFGPELRMFYEINSSLMFYTDAALSGTIFIMSSDVESAKSTFFPGISLGTGIENVFNNQYSGYFHMRFSVYFEQSVLITGFSPALGMNIRI